MNNLYQLYSGFPIFSNPIIPPEINYFQIYEQLQSQISQQSRQIQNLRKENLELKSHIQLLSLPEKDKKSQAQKQSTPKQRKLKIKKNKPQRTFFCDYENCNKCYSSTLALNLHVKTKHNGGTKKERDAYAKLIIMAELRGQPRPEINFTFSQNYLKKFKQKYLLESEFSNSHKDQVQKLTS